MEYQLHQFLIQTDITDSSQIQQPTINIINVFQPTIPENTIEEDISPKKRPRKVGEWIKEKRKIARQSGQEYVNSRNVLVRAKKFKYKICEKCPFKCTTKITYEAAKSIHSEFWKLTDTMKNKFYEKTTQKEFKKRERKRNPSTENSRRTYSFLYFFHVGRERVRVCRDFYVKTLNISPRRVAHYHEKVFEGVAMPHVDGRGKKTKIKISEETRQLIKDHIHSFPVDELLECKNMVKSPNALNTMKMYDLYTRYCRENNIAPAKLWLYRKIFHDEMNVKDNPNIDSNGEMEVTIYEDPTDENPEEFSYLCEEEEEEHNLLDIEPDYLNVEIEEDNSKPSSIISTKQFQYKPCDSKCTFNCLKRIDYETAKKIHGDFWKLSSYDRNNFYDSTTAREARNRSNRRYTSTKSRKFNFSFYFFVNNEKLRVCRDFYLNTLCISFTRVVYFYNIKLERMKKILEENS